MRSHRPNQARIRTTQRRSTRNRRRSGMLHPAGHGSTWRTILQWSLGAQFLWAGTSAALGQNTPADNQQPASPWSKPFAPSPTLLPPSPQRNPGHSPVSSSAIPAAAIPTPARDVGSRPASEVRRLSGGPSSDGTVRMAHLPPTATTPPNPNPPAPNPQRSATSQTPPPVAAPSSPLLPPAATVAPTAPAAPANRPATVKLLGPTPAPSANVSGVLPPSVAVVPSPTAAPSAAWNRVPAQGVILEPGAALANAPREAATVQSTLLPQLPPALPTALPPNLPAVALPSQTAMMPPSDWSDRRRITQGLPEQSAPLGRVESSMVSKSRVTTGPVPVVTNPLERASLERTESISRPLVFPTAPLLNSIDPGRFQSVNDSRSPEVISSLTPTEWQSIEIELKRRLEKCDAMLRRNGVHSAREEINQGLTILVRHIEALRQDEFASTTIQQPTLQSRKRRILEPALQQALVALDECADFHETIHYPPRRIERMVEHHATTALKGQNLDSMTNAIARLAYLEHAGRMFLIGTERHPWAAELLYALGKTYERELQFDAIRPITLRSQAAACFDAAHQIAPSYGYIANELGFTLVHLDRLEQAHAVLQSVLAKQPSAHAWRNLAEVHRRRGAIEESKLATAQADAMDQLAVDTPSKATNP
jgi:hypothetical protein